jgi:hypothetical protein
MAKKPKPKSEFLGWPNVGPATAGDLNRLGIRTRAQLARRDPLTLYERLSRLDGVWHDPCVIDVFLAVVEHAKHGKSRAWWTYTPRRKRLLKKLGWSVRGGSPVNARARRDRA